MLRRAETILFAVSGLVTAQAALLLGSGRGAAGLGEFFAGLLIAGILVPWAIELGASGSGQGAGGIWRRLLRFACVVDAISLVWLVLVVRDDELTLWQWAKAYILLATVAGGQVGVVLIARAIGLRGILPAAIGVLAAMAWLSSPLWLLHHLQTPGLLPWMQRLIDVQPLFAMNSVFPQQIWTEMPRAYGLLNLNQDVAYTLPRGPWAASIGHAIMALAGILIWVKSDSRRV